MVDHYLLNILREGRHKVKEGALYRHYKDKKFYRVRHLAINKEDYKIMVVYSAYNNGDEITWVRPLDTWLETTGGFPRFSRVE